ncbi:MAG: asparaginase domain-containing protein [Phycisphaerales bacterium]
MRWITLISTGGTLEKTYNERTGSLENKKSVLHRLLRRLRLEDVNVNIVELMQKDSLHMTDQDRARILSAVRDFGGAAEMATESTGIVVTHGTDTLERTGQVLFEGIPSPRVPIVLTGAWRPFELGRSDAQQNLTEALFGASVLAPGVWCVAHGRALAFPGVVKDRERNTFVRRDEAPA